MGKLFLGSVGTAQAFEIINGKPEIAFTSKTLTDSAVNISTTNDVVRGGTGAAGVFTFSHDATVDITLTDVLFKDAYIEAQLGASFGTPGAIAYQTETITAASTSIKVAKVPSKIGLNCLGKTLFAWIKEEAEDEFHTVDIAVDGTISEGITSGKTYCVRYAAVDNSAVDTIITTNIIPKEYFLVITCPLYAGDACSASNGKVAGSITFEIPRFKLNGAQDFSMNMSSNTTLSLAGTALAMDSGCSVNGSDLLRIVKVVEGNDLTTDLTALVAEDETGVHSEDVPTIYGIYKGGKVKVLDLADLTISPATAVDVATGKFAADASGDVIFTIKNSQGEVVSGISETIVVS